MIINATQNLQVSISELEQKRIVCDFLYKQFQWSENHFIKDGKVMKRVEYSTSHSWTDDEFCKEASEQDYFVAGLLKLIKKTLDVKIKNINIQHD